ncbi:hypothetical protein Trydic_g21134 [Trypoxylus dichotomus]
MSTQTSLKERATRETRNAKPCISQKQHKAVRKLSKAQPETIHSKATGEKRNLSESSTTKPVKPTETSKDENYPESSIYPEQAKLVRNCILHELDKLNVGGSEPRSNEVRNRGLAGYPKLHSLRRRQAETG